jgi:hypothetical protein
MGIIGPVRKKTIALDERASSSSPIKFIQTKKKRGSHLSPRHAFP